MVVRARVLLGVGQIDGEFRLTNERQIAKRRHIPRRDHLLDHFVEDYDLNADRFLLVVARLLLIRILPVILIVLPLDRDTDRVLAELLILFILLHEGLLASPHLHLTIHEGLALAVDGANVDLGLAFEHD